MTIEHKMAMGFISIQNITPISSFKANPIFSNHLHSQSHPTTILFNTTQFSTFPSNSVTPTISIHKPKRGFRGGVVAMAKPGSAQKSEEEWRAILSPEQFRILRQKGTEISWYPGTGEYDKFFAEGVYKCAGCGTPLYRSTTKFDSGCGWPAFYEGLPGAINRNPDPDGMRIEITCAACGGHLTEMRLENLRIGIYKETIQLITTHNQDFIRHA